MNKTFILLCAFFYCCSNSAMKPKKDDPCKPWFDMMQAAITSNQLSKTRAAFIIAQTKQDGCKNIKVKDSFEYLELYKTAGATAECSEKLKSNGPSIGGMGMPYYHKFCWYTVDFTKIN